MSDINLTLGPPASFLFEFGDKAVGGILANQSLKLGAGASTPAKGLVLVGTDDGQSEWSDELEGDFTLRGVDGTPESFPLGRAGSRSTGLNILSSFDGGEDDVNGVDTTGRINLYSYQRASYKSLGETIRHYIMRADAKAMIAWYLPKDGYNVDRTPIETHGYGPMWWIGAHAEANNHGSWHNHGSIEIPDSTGALQTRLEIPFVDQSTWVPGTPYGVDTTNIRTHQADFTISADSGVLRVGGAGVNRDILLSASSERGSSGERWKLRANSTTEAGSNVGSDFQINRYADNGTFLATALHIQRSTGNIGLGTTTVSAARLSAVWSASGTHGFYAAPSSQPGNGAAFAHLGTAATDRSLDFRVSGDGVARFVQFADGKHEWGDGTNGRDTNLYRSAADTLKTDDSFVVGASLSVLGNTTLKDANLILQDDSDATKQAQFQLSGITTGNTRTISIPDSSGTILLRSDTANVQNKTLDATNTLNVQDTLVTFQDDSDSTRKFRFNAGSVSTGSTRTLSVPNVSDTLVARSSTDTLSNKTMDAFSITDAANITLGTSTGTKIGTSASQKLGFYNATPVAQQTGVAVSAAGIHAALVNLGLITA